MMNCHRCGKPIRDKLSKCEYCGETYKPNQNHASLESRLAIVDQLVFSNITQTKISYESVQNLEMIVQQLEQRLSMDSENYEKIFNSILKVDETLQNKYPVREEIQSNQKDFENKTTSGMVEALLDLPTPEVNLSAYKIRSAIERQLRDFYKVPYVKRIGFVKNLNPDGTYDEFNDGWERYLIATNNENSSRKLSKQYRFLNLFIHDSDENNQKLSKNFSTLEDQKKYLLETLYKFKQYNLIWE
ncbi:hypothetical protein [Liberiplasma polymorphum]|uniref:hypothetical protein n=1 Tax=Liberiplasma polymorphum TaxID=3374570 RepID=UPI003772F6C7